MKKSDTNQLSLATASILGQPPSEFYLSKKNQHQNLLQILMLVEWVVE
jgi:hypothetical protein